MKDGCCEFWTNPSYSETLSPRQTKTRGWNDGSGVKSLIPSTHVLTTTPNSKDLIPLASECLHSGHIIKNDELQGILLWHFSGSGL